MSLTRSAPPRISFPPPPAPAAALSLRQLGDRIQQTVERGVAGPWLVVAEIAKLQHYRTCAYAELIEKQGRETVAKLPAVIFGPALARIDAAFRSVTGGPLAAGMRVLLRARVRFTARYGMQLVVEDVDPGFTLGDLARQRQETLHRLEREGLLTRNRELGFPLVPQRVAVISSPHAAGYEDFVQQLAENAAGFHFQHALFTAQVQGSAAEASLLAAFARLRPHVEHFDLVVLLRGGGAVADLHCFDGYRVAAAVAGCPLPVVTGIGHERDESVCDLVANRRAKTPTAAAELLITTVQAYSDWVESAAHRLELVCADFLQAHTEALQRLTLGLTAGAERRLRGEETRLEGAAGRFGQCVSDYLAARERELARLSSACGPQAAQWLLQQEHRLERQGLRLEHAVSGLLDREARRLERCAEIVNDCDPVNVLRRGYSLTYAGDRLVKSVRDVPAGTVLRTQLYDGVLVSTQVGSTLVASNQKASHRGEEAS